MLSVIVPIYNVEKYLPKCIESIMHQTYKKLEILLIDDGSTDSCPQICDKYAQIDHRIKVFHKSNEGLVRARKTGLSNASGDHIAFVDGDDWIDENMYLKLIEAMEISNADFIDSGYFCDGEEKYIIKRSMQEVYKLDPYAKHRFFKTLINLDDYIQITPSIWSKIFKADVIRDSYANVPDSMQYGEDVINLIHCFLRSDLMVQVEGVFYHYNYREDSMSHFRSASYIRKELVLWNYCGNIILKYDKNIKQEDIDNFLFRKLHSAFCYLSTHEFDTIQYYAFPCMEILFGKKIIIYGAGKVGRDYLKQIAKYEKCEIVCWVDKNYKNICLDYREVIGVENIFGKVYDIILLAVAEKQMADEMKRFLLKHDVLGSKILWHEPSTIV